MGAHNFESGRCKLVGKSRAYTWLFSQVLYSNINVWITHSTQKIFRKWKTQIHNFTHNYFLRVRQSSSEQTWTVSPKPHSSHVPSNLMIPSYHKQGFTMETANLFPVCMAHILAPLNVGIRGLRLWLVTELPVAATKFLLRMLAIIVAGGYQGECPCVSTWSAWFQVRPWSE